MRQGALVLVLGAGLSALSLAVGGVVRAGDAPGLLAALEAQVPVYAWEDDDAAPDVLFVDGRSPAAFREAHREGAVNLPYEELHESVFDMPDARPVRVAVVVMERDRAHQARELAQWLGREWGLPKVAVLRE